jgi:hypothetical protein
MKLSFRIELPPDHLTPGKDGYFIIISMSEFKLIFFTATVLNNAHGFRSLKSSIFQPCLKKVVKRLNFTAERLSKLRNCCLAECIKGKKTRWRQVKQNLLAIMGGEETIRPPNQCQYFGASYPPLTAGYSSTLPPLTAGYSSSLPPLTEGHRVGRVLSVSPVVGIGTPPPL